MTYLLTADTCVQREDTGRKLHHFNSTKHPIIVFVVSLKDHGQLVFNVTEARDGQKSHVLREADCVALVFVKRLENQVCKQANTFTLGENTYTHTDTQFCHLSWTQLSIDKRA